ncbi:MAG: hypothetical protein WAL63_17565 [Solirubrobacteraceae bacterium]
MAIDTIPGVTSQDSTVPRIAGLSVLKGLVLYGAILTFAGLYGYFVIKIAGARAGSPPHLDATLVSAAAALSGVLGSAFALEIGTPPAPDDTNRQLDQAIGQATGAPAKTLTRIWQALSLDPSSTSAASWPKTVGIWVYAGVASAVAITYVLHQHETPDAIKALAVAFGGYVIALVTAAYKSSS